MIFEPPVRADIAEYLRVARYAHTHGGLSAQFVFISSELKTHGPAYQAFSQEEEALSQLAISICSKIDGTSWYHGGRAGRQPGDRLISVAQGARTVRRLPRPAEADRFVYLTLLKSFAMSFAMTTHGALYEVIPDTPPKVAPYDLRALKLLMQWDGGRAFAEIVPAMLLEFVCGTAKVKAVLDPVEPLYNPLNDIGREPLSGASSDQGSKG